MARRKNNQVRASERDSRYDRKSFNGEQTFFTKDSKVVPMVSPVKSVRRTVKKQVELIPKTINQERYIMALMDENIDVVVVGGPAGTGKTYLAMLAAIKALKDGTCSRIVLTRPAVTVDDEDHGFLPGDLNQKMEPWTRPALDVLREFYTAEELQTMLEEQTIEISPLAYMRGRTFKDCWIVGDEMQNSSIAQCKMLLTRIGSGSKIILTGDREQSDKISDDCGLADLEDKLSKYDVPGMALCEFDMRDVQRHRLISHVLKLYK